MANLKAAILVFPVVSAMGSDWRTEQSEIDTKGASNLTLGT